MREILFRGKRVDNGEWVYGNYIEKIDPCKEDPVFWASLIHDKALSCTQVIPETVGQFTGLLDKNGDRIFEGQTLDLEGELFTVFYDTKEAGYAVRHTNKSEHYLEEIASESIIIKN